MLLTVQEAVTCLSSSADAIRSLAHAVPPEQAVWKPAPEKWSTLEVINHLADEEVEDFRTRLDLVLHRPREPLPPIDPEGWVVARAYNQRDLAESLARFLEERQRSLAWLGTLSSPDWERSYEHPRAGPLTAGTLLGSWLAHDLLHIRQLARLHYQYLAQQVHPHSLGYAGEW